MAKLNMLILAGYAPYLRQGRLNHPRICSFKPGEAYSPTRQPVGHCLWFDAGETLYAYVEGYIVGSPAEWDQMRLETCPDELIYQAIEATTG